MTKPYEINQVLPYKHPTGITYKLVTTGYTWSSLVNNAMVYEVGDDGREMTSYELLYANQDVMEAIFTLISETLLTKPFPGSKVLLHPDTHKLTIRAKYDLGQCNCGDFYQVLNCLFKKGYGPLNELEIEEIKAYVDRRLI